MRLLSQTHLHVTVSIRKTELARMAEVLATTLDGSLSRNWPVKYHSDLKLLKRIAEYGDARNLMPTESVTYGLRGLCPIVDLAPKGELNLNKGESNE